VSLAGTRGCGVIENYRYRLCPKPEKDFRSLVSIHIHSSYSIENLASLNEVVKLRYMQPFRETLQGAFGLDWVRDLDYAEVRYNPPLTPEGVFRLETAAIRRLGFDCAGVSITDHDEVAGSLDLLRRRPADSGRIALGEELSIRYRGHLFHLGISGLEELGLEDTHRNLQLLAQQGELDELFELLRTTRCLVVLNHPLISWAGEQPADIPVIELLSRYGWAIHALEFNGMRRSEENDRVLELARQVGKPVVGGGDSHLLLPSSVLCASPGAATFADFVEEVKSGVAVPFVKRDYFAPLKWKLFLRVLSFIRDYRRIAHFRGEPASRMLQGEMVMLDPVGVAARVFLGAASALGLAR
jgi:hypothetical protein